MPFTAALYEPMLDGGAAVAVSASLHTSDPGTTGAGEITGGGYARQSVTWASAVGDSVSTAAPLVFNVPAIPDSGRVTYLGLWDASGAWVGGMPLATPQPFPSAGTLTVNPATLSLSS